ncbi:MAG: carboxypeptidase-like regulatory domain-containing protein [Ignavibacteria bacterium]|nr:carboxypeptidase-like regulatory domain-containing protein [Ignavibacteria bacterium]
MIKLLKILSPIFVFSIIIILSGCESSGSSSGTSVIRGRAIDSVTFVQLIGATITTTPATSTVLADSLGNFEITGIEPGAYTITASKAGYYTTKTTVELSGDDTANVVMKLLYLNIFSYNNIIVDEYFNDQSYSGVNVYLGNRVTELDNANKDIQLRDSSGTSTNFFFRSGDLALRLAGRETKFSDLLVNPLNGTNQFSKTEFDTLTRINTVDGQIDPNRDFPNDRTPYFNDPLATNFVFAVFLKGRNLSPPTYALIYAELSYRNNMFHVVLDIKTNRNGKNLFNPNNR